MDAGWEEEGMFKPSQTKGWSLARSSRISGVGIDSMDMALGVGCCVGGRNMLCPTEESWGVGGWIGCSHCAVFSICVSSSLKGSLVRCCHVKIQCQKDILFFHMTGEQIMTLKCPLTSRMRASKQGLGIVIQFMSSAILVYS